MVGMLTDSGLKFTRYINFFLPQYEQAFIVDVGTFVFNLIKNLKVGNNKYNNWYIFDIKNFANVTKGNPFSEVNRYELFCVLNKIDLSRSNSMTALVIDVSKIVSEKFSISEYDSILFVKGTLNFYKYNTI